MTYFVAPETDVHDKLALLFPADPLRDGADIAVQPLEPGAVPHAIPWRLNAL